MAKTYWVTFGTGNPNLNAGLAPTFIQFWNSSGATVAPPSISQIGASSGLFTFSYTPTLSMGFVIDGATSSLGNGRYIFGSLDPADRIDEYGTTIIAIGTSQIAQGVSILAQGVSMLAFGASNLAIGTSVFALGTTNLALGFTNLAYGVSNFALGTSIYAQGSTILGYGVSIYAQGVTNAAGFSNIGTIGSTFGGVSSDPQDLFGYLKRLQEVLEGNASFDKSAGTWSLYSRGASMLLRSKTLTNDTIGVTKV